MVAAPLRAASHIDMEAYNRATHVLDEQMRCVRETLTQHANAFSAVANKIRTKLGTILVNKSIAQDESDRQMEVEAINFATLVGHAVGVAMGLEALQNKIPPADCNKLQSDFTAQIQRLADFNNYPDVIIQLQTLRLSAENKLAAIKAVHKDEKHVAPNNDEIAALKAYVVAYTKNQGHSNSAVTAFENALRNEVLLEVYHAAGVKGGRTFNKKDAGDKIFAFIGKYDGGKLANDHSDMIKTKIANGGYLNKKLEFLYDVKALARMNPSKAILIIKPNATQEQLHGTNDYLLAQVGQDQINAYFNNHVNKPAVAVAVNVQPVVNKPVVPIPPQKK